VGEEEEERRWSRRRSRREVRRRQGSGRESLGKTEAAGAGGCMGEAGRRRDRDGESSAVERGERFAPMSVQSVGVDG
jgi:hypothetical protein